VEKGEEPNAVGENSYFEVVYRAIYPGKVISVFRIPLIVAEKLVKPQ
jgi:hypothetical protein